MMLRRRKSLTTRLTLLFAVVSSSVLLILGLVIAELVERHFEDMDLELLEGKLELIQHAVISARAEGDFDGLPAQLDAALIGHHGLAVGVWGSDGKQLYLSEGQTSLKEIICQNKAAPFLEPGRERKSNTIVAPRAWLQLALKARRHWRCFSQPVLLTTSISCSRSG